jgi:hypothetical protein
MSGHTLNSEASQRARRRERIVASADAAIIESHEIVQSGHRADRMPGLPAPEALGRRASRLIPPRRSGPAA